MAGQLRERLRLFHLTPRQVRDSRLDLCIDVLANPGAGLPEELKGEPGQDCWLLQPPCQGCHQPTTTACCLAGPGEHIENGNAKKNLVLLRRQLLCPWMTLQAWPRVVQPCQGVIHINLASLNFPQL